MCWIFSEEERREHARQRQEAHQRWLAEERARELEGLRMEIERHQRLLAYCSLH